MWLQLHGAYGLKMGVCVNLWFTKNPFLAKYLGHTQSPDEAGSTFQLHFECLFRFYPIYLLVFENRNIIAMITAAVTNEPK